MNIPHSDERVEIVHAGDRLPAVVESVAPAEERGIFRVRIRVPKTIPRGDHVDLVTEEGVFHLAVHESDENRIELRAYEGMRPRQN
jgi:hypothetical protein